jgi:integrase
MASIQKRLTASGTTTYVVKWKDHRGDYRTKGGFKTKKAAETYAATEVEPKRRRGIAVTPSAGKVAFRDTAAKWLASRHDLKDTTRAAYTDALAPTPATGPRAKRHERLRDLRIDTVLGDYPINAITRDDISQWVAAMVTAGKKPSTVRNAYFLVRQVLAQAVADDVLPANPADYVKLPTDHNTGRGAVVDDPAMFLSAAQLAALVAATPWPYNVLVHLAAWSGLRAAELAGLQVGDVTLPPSPLNPNAPAKPGLLRIQRTLAWVNGEAVYMDPKTKGSRRNVPLPAMTVAMLREYLAAHPRRQEPEAPLFPSVHLSPPRPIGVRTATADTGPNTKATARRQAEALAELTPAEATGRLVLDWRQPLRHATFYKGVFRPAVLRANRCAAETDTLPPALKFHALRHTYASLCIAAGRPMFEVARFMGHARPSTTETVYAHLLTDDHSDAMAALAAMEAGPNYGPNVVPLWG